MSFNRSLRVVAPFAIAALALGMTACGSDEPESTPTITVTASAQESTATEPTMESSEPIESSEPMEETTEPAVSEDPIEEPVGPNDESGVVDVTVVGDEGILALQHSGTTPLGAAGPSNPKLITGPGGCFALVNEGKPQLVVFPSDATFVLQEGKPSATFGGTEHFVGRQMDVASIAVPKSDVAGIPDQCTQGSDDTVIVIS